MAHGDPKAQSATITGFESVERSLEAEARAQFGVCGGSAAADMASLEKAKVRVSVEESLSPRSEFWIATSEGLSCCADGQPTPECRNLVVVKEVFRTTATANVEKRLAARLSADASCAGIAGGGVRASSTNGQLQAVESSGWNLVQLVDMQEICSSCAFSQGEGCPAVLTKMATSRQASDTAKTEEENRRVQALIQNAKNLNPLCSEFQVHGGRAVCMECRFSISGLGPGRWDQSSLAWRAPSAPFSCPLGRLGGTSSAGAFSPDDAESAVVEVTTGSVSAPTVDAGWNNSPAAIHAVLVANGVIAAGTAERRDHAVATQFSTPALRVDNVPLGTGDVGVKVDISCQRTDHPNGYPKACEVHGGTVEVVVRRSPRL